MKTIFLSLLLTVPAAFGQAPTAAAPASSNTILVQFQLDPDKGMPADDLRSEEIELRVDGKPHAITIFEGGRFRARTLPLQIGLFFDCAGSSLVTGAISPNVFHEKLLDEFPNASVAIYGFSNQLIRLTAPTRDQARLMKGIGAPMFKHPIETFLVTHVENAVRDMAASGPAIRMIAVFSNGLGDPTFGTEATNQQRYNSAIQAAQLAGVALYPVLLREQFGLGANVSSMPTVGTASAPKATAGLPMLSTPSEEPIYRAYGNFKNLAPPTGGESMELLLGTNMLPQVLQNLSNQIRRTYAIGFVASPSTKAKRHKVQIILRTKGRGALNGANRTLVY